MIKVAIADDQLMVRQGIASLLSLRTDIQVVWQADNGEDALVKLAEHPVDILLTDIRMPVKNGVETVHALRNNGNDTRAVSYTHLTLPTIYSV